MVNFTLVFIRGNKTVEELVKVLEDAVKNGTVNSIAIERETLWLVLPRELTVLHICFVSREGLLADTFPRFLSF